MVLNGELLKKIKASIKIKKNKRTPIIQDYVEVRLVILVFFVLLSKICFISNGRYIFVVL